MNAAEAVAVLACVVLFGAYAHSTLAATDALTGALLSPAHRHYRTSALWAALLTVALFGLYDVTRNALYLWVAVGTLVLAAADYGAATAIHHLPESDDQETAHGIAR